MFVLVEGMYMEDTYSDEYNTEVFWIFSILFQFNRSAPNTPKIPSPGIVFLDFALGDKG